MIKRDVAHRFYVLRRTQFSTSNALTKRSVGIDGCAGHSRAVHSSRYSIIHRRYYMAPRRYEISLRVLKKIFAE